MKICQFCGTENKDMATTCASCGGNEFKNKCVNCGNVFDEGNFCPTCGVKIGSKPKKCPNCGNEYFSAACPDCGHTDAAGLHEYAYSSQNRQRRTWLWVLGWIFIFPVPVTIIVSKNYKLSGWLKGVIITAVWILYFALAAFGESDTDSPTKTPSGTSSGAYACVSVQETADVERA